MADSFYGVKHSSNGGFATFKGIGVQTLYLRCLSG